MPPEPEQIAPKLEPVIAKLEPSTPETLKDKWARYQSIVAIPALIFGVFWAVVTLVVQLVQYNANKEPAIELKIRARQLQIAPQPQNGNFYLAVTVTAKNVGSRNITMCFEDPIDSFVSNCDPKGLTPGQFTNFVEDQTESLKKHRDEILLDNDQNEIEKLKTGQSKGWNKQKEADFNDKFNTLQRSQGEGQETANGNGFKRPHIPPISVTPVMCQESPPGFEFAKPIPADLWREDKHMPKQWLKGLYVRAGQTESFTTLVPVPSTGLYRVGFAVRLPKEETGLSPILEPIWSAGEFVVVKDTADKSIRGKADKTCKIAENTPQSPDKH